MLLFVLLLFFVGLAAGLAWFLIGHDHGEKEPIGMLWVAVFLGLLGGVAASYLEQLFVNGQDLLPGSPAHSMFGAMLLVGIIEEACKFAPLAILIFNKRYFNEHTDGIIYFALAGLGFGLPENILYTVQYGAQTGMTRAVLTPLFHAGITGIIGYFLIKCKLEGKSVYRIIPILLAAMGLHGLYDFGLTVGSNIFAALSVLITLCVSVALFALYVRATELDQDRGLSSIGHNSYCRSCGQANPKHHLYCTKCGKNA